MYTIYKYEYVYIHKIGMVGLVIFMVGFLYYFRRQAWKAQLDISSKYRDKNMKHPDPKTSKGGIFSLDNFKNIVKGK
jgi:hypothetical protein